MIEDPEKKEMDVFFLSKKFRILLDLDMESWVHHPDDVTTLFRVFSCRKISGCMRDCGPVVIMFDLEFLRFSRKSTTLPETNSSPLKISLPNRKVVFQPYQPSIFRGENVSFREGNQQKHLTVFCFKHF